MTQTAGVWGGYIWSAQINGAPAGTAGDLVADLTVDNGDAGPEDILDGMTVFVGTVKGDNDKGTFRIRGDQTVNGATVTLDIGATSEVIDVIEDDDWVVVVEEFRLWTRYPVVTEAGGVLSWFKDYDITYAGLGGTAAARRQAQYPPVPIMGPHRVAFMEIGGTVDVDFDWSNSYAAASGGTVNDWDAYGQDGGAGWSVLNTENPPAQTYSNVSGLGGYRARLEVGSDLQDPPARFRRGIRYVFTLRRPGETQAGDPTNAEPITDFAVSGLQGSWDDGAWRATITIFDTQASEVSIWDGALVILFAEDWYGSTKGSIGPIAGAENIVFIGRVADGTVQQNDQTGDVAFDIISAAGQARNREMYPIPLENDAGADEWYKGPDLTVDRAAWFYAVWHSTIPLICDWYDSDDTEEIRAIDFLAGDVYSVMDGFYRDRLFARVLCDRYERWKADIDLQMQTAASGTTSFTMQETDWIGQLQFRDTTETPTGIVEVGGLNYNAGLITPYLAKAPGTVNRLKGRSDSAMNLAIADQATLNTLGGRRIAKLNNRWPQSTFPLAGNWRYPDIWPQEYVNVTQDTVRHDFASDLFIVRGIQFNYEPTGGALFTTLEVELETDGPDGQTIDIPDELPTRPLPPKPYFPPAPPPTPSTPSGTDTGRRMLATDVGVFACNNIGDTNPVWYGVNSGLSSASDLNVYDIKRDPYHWWTSGGTERTLWAFNRTGIWKLEDFPFGTWSQEITYAALLAAFGYADNSPNYCYKGRMGFSIENDGLYSCAFNLPDTAGFGGTQNQVVIIVDDGVILSAAELDDWANFGADSALGYPDTVALPHSAGQSFLASTARRADNIIESRGELYETVNQGVAWSSIDGPFGFGDGGQFSSAGAPYVDASNSPDQYYLWGRGGNVAGAFGLYRTSSDAGTTFADINESNHQYSRMFVGGSPDFIAFLPDRPDLTPFKWTVDGGVTYTTAPLHSAAFITFAGFIKWGNGNIESVLAGGVVAGVIQVLLWEPGMAAWQNKTGNLASFGVAEIRQVDRDSMGTA
jgi:hypothetical protein